MQRVTRAEAARALGVSRATVTRRCQQHPALLDNAGMVCVDDLREIERTLINPAQQTRRAAEPVPAQSMNDHRTRRERALADEAELDLAARLGATLDRRALEAAVAEAAEMIKQAGQQLSRSRAEAMTRIGDVREMERALEEFFAEAMRAGTARLSAAVEADQDADAA